jgi:hypothetical protein
MTIMKNIYKLFTLVLCFAMISISCSEEGLTESGIGTVSGTVVSDGDNMPLANVKITSNPSSNTVFTSESGEFIIPSVLVGEYSFQAELDGYTTQFKPVTVIDGVETNVVFELELANQNNDAPLAPVLVNPTDGEQDVSTNVDFIWLSSDNDEDMIEYTFELRDGDNDEIIMVESLQDTTFTVPNLALGTTYFWQVSANDMINDPVVSNLSSFTTIDGSDNRFFYVRKMGNNNVIFSGDDSNDSGTSNEPNENEIQITSSSENSFRPRRDPTSGKVAFLRTVGANTQLFVMKFDGSEEEQITDEIPVSGWRQEEVDFTWYGNGNRIVYPSLNKLYSVTPFGTGNTMIYEAPAGRFITEVDANEFNGLLAIKTNDASGYNAKISIINPNTGIESVVVLDNVNGAVGGIDYSIDASKVLYSRDVTGFENPDYQILDSRIFVYDIATDTAVEIDTNKPAGTNNLDPKYSPDEGAIIYVNTSADGISQKDIYKHMLDSSSNETELLFTDAFMPDWK